MNSYNGSDKHETLPNISQEFKDTLETLVLEILQDKPNDPIQFASDFFIKKLENRPAEPKVNVSREENVTKEQDFQRISLQITKQPCETKQQSLSSEIKAATIIQAYFRGYNVRRLHQWTKRFFVTKLHHHDHLSVQHFVDSPRESFSGYSSDVDGGNVYLKYNYDSDESTVPNEEVKF